MNLIMLINMSKTVSYSCKKQTKENTITLTVNKKKTSDVNLANNLQITYAKFIIYLTEKFLM